jgi:drug/metabolite transporter (DMT)-like permease
MKIHAPNRPARPALQIGLFAIMCLIWGLTWIPIKIGVSSVPPMLFAASRGLAAGAILLALHGWRVGRPVVAKRHLLRLLGVGFLANAATYGLLFWGMARVESGLAAVVNMSLIQISLLAIAVLMGEERLTTLKAVSAATGVVGLSVLYAGKLAGTAAGTESAGLAAVALSAVAYGLGSVLSRELLRRYSPLLVGGWVLAAGGVLLLPLSMVLEAEGLAALRGLAALPVLLSWSYLVLFGSVIAFTVYLRLTRDWSPSRAGFYAFVSPAVAVMAGIVVLQETVGPREALGIALLMTGTCLALRRARVQRPSPLPVAGEIARGG